MDTLSLPALKDLVAAAIRALPFALLVLVGAAAARLLLGRMLKVLADRTRLEPADLLPLKTVLNSLLYVVATVLVLTAFGANLGGLWAILSTILAMVAIGFVAVWSLLSNISCTLIILFFRPFAIGDEIEFTGEPVKGKVVDLNFLYTTLRTEDGGFIQIPNNMFFQKSIKRRPGASPTSLAQQLNRPQAAEV
jgi:small-conductance mechanosensitive channel